MSELELAAPAAAEQRVRQAACELWDALSECEQTGANGTRAFLEGIPVDLEKLVSEQPILGSILMAVGVAL